MDGPEAPDTTKADANAARMVDLNEEQFAWVKEQWVADAPNREAAAARAREVSDEQLLQMRDQRALAQESASDYRRIYRPLEEAAAREAAEYNSEARREQAAGEAVAGVTQNFDQARQSAERNMASMGINPSDGAFGAQQAQLTAAQALGSAGAANRAREQVATVGRALRADAIGVGRGVISGQGTQAGVALNAGNASVGNAGVPLNVSAQGVGMVQGAATSATNGLNAAGNIYQRSAEIRANSQGDGGAGLAGAAMSAAAIF
jgi:hypothetical protein